jgi:hypothetical protein
MTDIPTVDLNTRVGQYIKLRDKIKELDDEFKTKIKPYKETLEQLNSALLQHLEAMKGESVRTPSGTVYRTAKKNASIADMEAFWAFVVTQSQWDMLDKRANATAVADYINEQAELAKSDPTIQPAPPPGVNFSVTHVVGVRRS